MCVRADTSAHSAGHAWTDTHAPPLTRSLLHTYWIHRCEGNRWTNERGEKKGKAPQKIINAVRLGPLATGIPLTGVTCLPNKQAARMSEKWKWWLEVAWPVKRSLVSMLAYVWELWWYFREMRRLRATPGLQECLAEFVLCYWPQASQAAPGPSGVTGADGQFLSFSLWRLHSTSGQKEKSSRITIKQNNHLDLSSQTWGLPLWITVTLTSNKTSYTQPTLQQGSW